MSTVDRALSLLRLFEGDQPEWTVEAAARELGLSQSTAYEYFRSLVESGLLSTYRTGRYVIGPAIIELDRQTRLRDPLIRASQEVMDDLVGALRGNDDVVLLCRLYKLKVMCIDQRAPKLPKLRVSYERGLPMPLEKGAASKSILANLPPRILRRFFDQRFGGGAEPTWADFRRPLREIRRVGYSITHGELDPGRVGLSAPVFVGDGDVVGSIGLVLSEDSPTDLSAELKSHVVEAAREVSARLAVGVGKDD